MSDSWQSLLAAHDASRDLSRSAAPRHAPLAAVLTCSDARVSPSVIFDQPSGSLFVARVAGNIVTSEVRASFDYAVAKLGVRLVVVLGHTGCGAVAAACAGMTDSYLQPLTTPIATLSPSHRHDADELAERNVRVGMTAMRDSTSPVGQAIRSGDVTIEGAIYDLAQDRIRPITHLPNQSEPNQSEDKRHQGVAPT